MKNWGTVAIGTRLEKAVEPGFMKAWSMLITHGLRPGDAWMIEDGKVAHRASNDLVRRFLKSNLDTLFLLDSDADFGYQALSELRDHTDGWKYDGLQAFYTRRGWPPEAIWFKRDALGGLYQCIVYGEDVTQDVALVGTHCVLLRREMLKGMRDRAAADGVDPDKYEWFHYPRHSDISEDSAFSMDATEQGYQFGATTHVKFGHISRVTTGWETYQEVLELSGQNQRVRDYQQLLGWLAEFTGQERALVEAKVFKRSQTVIEAWQDKRPKTPAEVRGFYGWNDNGYLYDLAAWNASTGYLSLIEPLKAIEGQRVLVFGSGLGTECAALAEKNVVDAFDVPGVLRNFCEWRPDRKWRMLDGETARDIDYYDQYDLIVAMDVIEHIHPDELVDTLDALWNATAPGGRWYLHVDFNDKQYPMHYDHRNAFGAWMIDKGLLAKESMVSTNGVMWLQKALVT
jgi:hypothetical protein